MKYIEKALATSLGLFGVMLYYTLRNMVKFGFGIAYLNAGIFVRTPTLLDVLSAVDTLVFFISIPLVFLMGYFMYESYKRNWEEETRVPYRKL